MLLHVVHIVVHLHQTVVRDSQRASRSILHTTIEHHLDDGVLDNLGVDVEIGNVLVLAQSAEDGVGSRAYTALQGKELLGDTALVHLLYKELSSQETNLICYGVAILEGTGLVRDVTLYDTYHLLFGNRDIGLTDAVANMLNGNSLAVRGI